MDAGDRRSVLDHSRLKMAHVEFASVNVREMDGGARRGDAGDEQEATHFPATLGEETESEGRLRGKDVASSIVRAEKQHNKRRRRRDEEETRIMAALNLFLREKPVRLNVKTYAGRQSSRWRTWSAS